MKNVQLEPVQSNRLTIDREKLSRQLSKAMYGAYALTSFMGLTTDFVWGFLKLAEADDEDIQTQE